jgi:hypothetical protein
MIREEWTVGDMEGSYRYLVEGTVFSLYFLESTEENPLNISVRTVRIPTATHVGAHPEYVRAITA